MFRFFSLLFLLLLVLAFRQYDKNFDLKNRTVIQNSVASF